jgi:uncharacterized protein (TIGR00661 family)
MKYLFLVQGEGRGHMTQSISLKQQLESHGHEVCSVLVGKSKDREIPSFFLKKTKKPVIKFDEPSFIRTHDKKGVRLLPSIIYNLFNINQLKNQLRIIKQEVNTYNPDVIVNFYCIMGGLYFLFYKPKAYKICIAHQYMFLHPAYVFPDNFLLKKIMLRLLTKLTALCADNKLALSFYPKKNMPKKKLHVVPPLLRPELFSLQQKKENYLLCYILNDGYRKEIMSWQKENPKQEIHLFGEKKGITDEFEIQPNLFWHHLNDHVFLRHLANCAGYASTAGFESICEAMYLKKPVFLVPTRGHIEQQCNAFDAEKAGAGIMGQSFVLEKLQHFIMHYKPVPEYKEWVHSAPAIFTKHMITLPLERGYSDSDQYKPVTSLVPG